MGRETKRTGDRYEPLQPCPMCNDASWLEWSPAQHELMPTAPHIRCLSCGLTLQGAIEFQRQQDGQLAWDVDTANIRLIRRWNNDLPRRNY